MLNAGNRSEEILADEMAKLHQERPYLGSLLTSFGPLLLEMERWRQKGRVSGGRLTIDPLAFAQGATVVEQSGDFLLDDRWQAAGSAAAEAIGTGFPDLSQDMKRLKSRMDADLDSQSLYLSAIEGGDVENDKILEELAVGRVSMLMFLRAVERLVLRAKSHEAAEAVESLTWRKGFCPICGGFPQLATIREKGQRWLHCSCCSHEWTFPRMTCPYCEHEDPENTGVIFVEGRKEEMVYTCSTCRRYLVTSEQAANLSRKAADIIAIGPVHLDLVGQKQGFVPMAACEWNTFEHSDLKSGRWTGNP